MGKILSRIEQIALNEGITIGALERKIGASKGVLSRAIAKDTDIQSKWLQILVENYPHYSAEWLLTGEGTMLKGEGHVAPSEVHPSEKKATASAPDAATLMSLLHDKDATIRQLSEQIGILKERIRGIERDKAKPASPALDTPDALIG